MAADGAAGGDRSATGAAADPVGFIKKVGKGKTLSQDLDPSEARRAFDLALSGGFTQAQLGAFLQALRIKELTQEELDALAAAFRDRLPALPPLRGARTLALNLASDTSRKGGLASLLAAALLRRFGVGVGAVRSEPVLSGNLASFETSLELARRFDPDIAVADTTGPAEDATARPSPEGLAPPLVVAHCRDLVPGLAALDGLRGELGFRSCLHTAEKLVNPWPASPVLLGISHKHYALRMAGTLRALGLAGRVLLGNHGTVDLVIHKETEMVIAGPGGVAEARVAPADLGLSLASEVYSLGKLGEWPAWVEDLRSGSPGPGGRALRDAVLYHLAVFLWAAGAVPDPAAGLAAARAKAII
jgi:anthranilate phosphoribosyltransferase